MRFLHSNCVWTKGYKWSQDRLVRIGAPKRRGSLFDELKLTTGGFDIRYPFERNESLFMDFAQLEKKRDAVVQFANTYGELNEWEPDYVAKDGTAGNSFAYWKKSIQEMHEAVGIWQIVQQWKPEQVQKIVAWARQQGCNVPTTTTSRVLDESISTDNSERITVFALLQRLFDESHEQVRHRVELRYDLRNQRLYPILVVSSLWHALWVQLSNAMSEDRQFRDCLYCGKKIDLSEKRNDRLYCTDACRRKADRKRKSEAKRMRREGMSLVKIQKHFGTDRKTLKKWLGET